ncbi:MAG: hypothetical protein WBA23_08555 [Tunicatimonas sp.]|uniref:hypothetical protein n=1 Tax=Tunicatimonas sp. TaxID=1940096 RepID=UPI003C7494ED
MPKENQFLNQSFTALSNAIGTPLLLVVFSKYGYDEKTLKQGLALHAKVGHITKDRDAANGVVRRATRSLNQAKDTTLRLFSSHMNVARTAFAREGYADDMRITGRREGATIDWLEQAKKFYTHVPVDLMVKYHVPKKELDEANKMVSKVTESLSLQRRVKSQAQQLTQDRRATYRELHIWMKRFMGIARIVFADQPQQLEALGLIVKA